MIFFTADQHFGHENIIKYVGRPFTSAEEMDEELIRRWNAVVGKSDTVYVLGDFTLGEDAHKYFDRLNGWIRVVPSLDHDVRWNNCFSHNKVSVLCPLATLQFMEHSLDGIHPRLITLCHYRMASWPANHFNKRGAVTSIHLHGHHHMKQPINLEYPACVDVGVDAWSYAPASIEEILALLG